MHTSNDNTNREDRIKRLLYQSWYRGCKETDKILGYFAKKHLQDFSDNELGEFENILNENDNDIFNWMGNNSLVPERYKNSRVMNLLLSFDVPAQLGN